MIRVLFLGAVLSLGLTTAAFPCRVPQPASEVVFYDLPPNLPAGLTVLKVTFPPSGPVYPGATPRLALVQGVAKGAYSGKSLNVLVDGAQSGGCRWAITSGKAGYIVGRLDRGASGAALLLPIYETVADRRKRGGIQKPDPPPAQPVVKPFLIDNPVWAKEPAKADMKRYRPAGDAPPLLKWGVHVRCRVAANGGLHGCKSSDVLGGDSVWAAAATKVAGLFRMQHKTAEGWTVEGGEVDLQVLFDPPGACLASRICR